MSLTTLLYILRIVAQLWYVTKNQRYGQKWVFIEIPVINFIGNNLLVLIAIAQNSFDLSIIDIAFAMYFVIADKLSPCINDCLCT